MDELTQGYSSDGGATSQESDSEEQDGQGDGLEDYEEQGSFKVHSLSRDVNDWDIDDSAADS